MNLKWTYDGDGEWTAITNVMDPDMTDKPRADWCPEWCIAWHIGVNEEGEFCIDDSDRLLLDNYTGPHFFKTLGSAQGAIDLVNDYVHGLDEFENGEPVVLLNREGAVKT